MTVGDRIKIRRKQLGISADLLASKVGVSRSTVFRWEKGDIEKVPGDTLVPIAKALGVTPSFLMGWEADYEVAQDNEMAELLQTLRERPEIKMLFEAGKKATPETVRQTARFLEGLARSEESD